MAKGQGRPRRKTGVQNQSNVSKEENEQASSTTGKISGETLGDATHNQETAQTEASSEKVLEVNTDSQKKPEKRPQPSFDRFPTFLVNVNGRDRQIGKLAYEAISKSPQIEIVLPKGSVLAEPVTQPCKDC